MPSKTIKLSQTNQMVISCVRVLFLALVIACNIRINMYIKKLEEEKCECADTNLSKFLKPSTIVASVVLCVKLLISLTGKSLADQQFMKNTEGKMISLILGLYLLAHSVCLVVYWFQLNKNWECLCSNKRDKFLLLYPIGILVFAFTIAVLVSILHMVYYS